MLTGKTIGQLTFLETPTSDTLIPVELNGETYHMAYSAITTNEVDVFVTGGTFNNNTLTFTNNTGGTFTVTGLTSGGAGGGIVETTYSELVNSITGETLSAGTYYLISDFKTCYDQPDFDYNGSEITSGNYKDDTEVQPIIVLAISSNTISDNAFQPAYPNDKIKYDWTFNQTEVTNGPAFGRITERIDEFNNRTDYDHRQIKFKRYRYWEIEFSNPYNGTVQVNTTSQTEMTVLGTNTNFLSLGVGTKVGFDNTNYKVFEITNIVDDFEMTVTGLTSQGAGPNIRMYSANWSEYSSYRQNNIETTEFSEYYTFDLGNNPNFNNYIGNFSNLKNSDNNPFLLANNVFRFAFVNNKFGDACYNNSFFDDCENNNIGNYFYSNITDDDFDGNLIGNYFNNNRITSNFQRNRIGESFEDNYLVQNDFYRNNIMNDFRNNQISNGDFQNNEIGSQFANNKIFAQFYKNDIGNGYNNNEHYSDVYGNLVGNGFNNNNIYCQFYENKIGDIFEGNDLGNENNFGSYSFYKNDIGSDFNNNDCLGTFAYNRIGSQFYNNILGDGFGYGVNASQGNTIGNYFYDNTIGEYFYNNTIADGFFNNNTFDFFQNNNVKIPFLNGIDFTFYYGNISAFTYVANGNSATEGLYTNLTGTTNGQGITAAFDVEVSGSTVISVNGASVGKYYSVNDTITILGSQIGGVNGVDDVVITITGVSSTPTVYESYNCELFINSNNTNRLSYYDGSDTLIIKNINE
jgi:hypothetical protein